MGSFARVGDASNVSAVKEFVLQSVLAVLLWMTVNERRIELCFPTFTMWPQAYRHFGNATDTLIGNGKFLACAVP
jgi:hypothetical protein